MQFLAGLISESQLNEVQQFSIPDILKGKSNNNNPNNTIEDYKPGMKVVVSKFYGSKEELDQNYGTVTGMSGGKVQVKKLDGKDAAYDPADLIIVLGQATESQVNEAEETMTPDQAIQKAMPLVSKIENSPALDKVAAEIAKDPSLMAQLEKALAKGGVQVNLNEAEGGLDQSDMKTLMLNFAKKANELNEEDDGQDVGLGMASVVIGGTIGAKMGGLIAAAIPAVTSVFAGTGIVGALAGLALFLVAKKIYSMNKRN
jgi:hypothetical protein